MKYLFLAALLMGIPEFILAQDNYGFQQEYFFGRLPNVATEAMGRADVAVGGTIPSLFYNPAAIGSIENQEVAISTSAPFYVLRESDYYFMGYARRINSRFTAALSMNRLAIGETTFDITIEGQRLPVETPSTTNYALSVAGQVVEGLVAGANLNVIRWKLFDDVSATSATPIDIGAVYSRQINTSGQGRREIRAGVGITNVLQTELSFKSDSLEDSDVMPSVARIGAAFVVDRIINIPGAGEAPLHFTATAEFQDVLTNEYRTGIRVGTEAVFYNTIAIRLGAFTHSIDDFGNEGNKSRLSDITYGAGLIIPVVDFTNGSFPVNAHVDYMAMKQPPFTESGRRIPNMRGFSIRLVWIANEGGE